MVAHRLILGVCLLLAALAGATAARPQAAAAHASLVKVTPGDGQRVARAPREVAFRFSERVESALGAIRVFDGSGRRVDAGPIERRGSDRDVLAVGLRPGTGGGAYTATYRVVSSDSHVITGGVVFRVGTGAGPAVGVAGAIGAGGAGVDRAAFASARVAAYVALLLGVGALVFLVCAWTPAVRRQGGADPAWAAASAAFAGRVRRIFAWATGIGIASSALGLLCQAATAGGVPLWSAASPDLLGAVLETRFGAAWGLRALAWAAFGLLVLGPRPALRGDVLRPATLGAEGLAVLRPLGPAALAALGALSVALAASVGLSGHAATGDAPWLAGSAVTLHVLGMSAWLGGLAVLLAALPAAARHLPPEPSRDLLAAGVRGVSRIALCAVAVVLATGIVQSLLRIDAPGELLSSTYGLLVAAKVVLFCGLLAFGAFNQRRVLPRLGGSGGSVTQALWLSVGGELAVFALALAATAALAAASPPGPAARTATAVRSLGPVRLAVTASPLRVGSQRIALALRDARTGRPVDSFDSLEVSLRLPGRGIGPLALELERSGPGRFATSRAQVTVPGDWRLDLELARSDFDLHRTSVPLRIR